MTGKMLGQRYRLEEQLGGGGMAVVYKAMDTLLNRLVTIKILRSEYASDEAFVERFRKEAQSIARLSHPNIVHIHDVGKDNNVHYLVMEFIEGQNLKDIIRKDAPLPVERVITLSCQVCDALEHAHKNNIVHRDVKPHNILITRDGRAKLTDFGIAKETSTATHTQADTIMGSVHYISPEQVRGEPACPQSDIYSLGVVIYEMLTGKLPFDGDTPISVAMKHIQDIIPPLHEINPGVSDLLSSVISKALEKNPRNRFESALEMKDALKNYKVVGINYKLSSSINDDMDTRIMTPLGNKIGNKKRSETIKHGIEKYKRLLISLPLILIFLVLTFVYAFNQFMNTPDIRVPDVTGRPVEEARSILLEKDLKVSADTEVFSEQPQGYVIRQSIGPDDPPVKPGRVIELIISKGPDLREVPDLGGMTESEASAALLERGLVLGTPVKTGYHDSIREGLVIEQVPSKGEMVEKDSEVQITLSIGSEPQRVNVPDLVNMKEEEAKAILQENNLVIQNVSWEPNNSVLYGRVIRQSPEANERVRAGSGVQLVLSNGPGPGIRETRINLDNTIPDDGREHRVQLVVEDAEGSRTEYANTHVYGDSIERNISYRGRALLKVYVDGEMVLERSVE